MSANDSFYPLALGTNRLPVTTEEDRKTAVRLCSEAFIHGVNYVDVAPTYSRGLAETIIGEAVRMCSFAEGEEPQVTIKVNSSKQNEGDAIRSAESSLSAMGLHSAEWFVCWSIKSLNEFVQITAPHGVYNAALNLKKHGIIRRISASLHAPPKESIAILESGLFEAVTLSVNAMNYMVMEPVIKRAGQLGIPVIVMNPLAGGAIPQTPSFFSFLRLTGDTSIAASAIRFLLAHDEIKCVLSGVSSIKELHENIEVISSSPITPQARISTVKMAFSKIEGFCSGCHYCDGCPNGIDVSRLMQAYNALLFPIPLKQYGTTDSRILENIQVCSKLSNTYHYIPKSTRNPCVSCGECEEKCTARLPISRRITELYDRFTECSYSYDAQLKRIRELIGESVRIALYPGGGYTTYIIELIRQLHFDVTPSVYLFDSNERLHGTFNNGLLVRSPDEIIQIKPDVIIVSNYIYGKEIFSQIRYYEDYGINVKMLHNPFDVPWVY